MKKLLLVANVEFTLTQFRKEFVKELLEKGYEVVAVVPEGEWGFVPETMLAELGVRKVVFELERNSLNPFLEMRTYRQLKDIMVRERPWGIMNYTIKPAIYGSMAAYAVGIKRVFSNITGLGHVFTNHSMRHEFLRMIVRSMYKIALRRNLRVFFQNPDDMELFVGWRIVRRAQCCVINGSGVDTSVFVPSKQVAPAASFLQLARLLGDKGVKEYVSAGRCLKRKYPQAVFRLMGPFDENPSSISPDLVKRWHNAGDVEYLGASSDVRSRIAQAAVYVFPSYREGTPRSVLEAMSMGKPIITTDVPGCRETVVDGENGFLVPPRNPKLLAEAMERFIKKPGLIRQMGERSRVLAVEKYDVHKVNDAIISAMELDSE